MRTIRVTGKGQLKVHPDMTRITMELKGGSREYGETLEKSAKETEQLKDILTPFGFDRTDLKTLRFDVETLYESYQEKKVWKERFNGYQYCEELLPSITCNTLPENVIFSLRCSFGRLE